MREFDRTFFTLATLARSSTSDAVFTVMKVGLSERHAIEMPEQTAARLRENFGSTLADEVLNYLLNKHRNGDI